MKGYKVNRQVYLSGGILCVGIYDESKIRDKGAISFIEEYCKKQKTLPLEKKDIPPYFEIVDTDKKVESVDDKVEQKLDDYVSMNINKLKELCKQRGLEVKSSYKKVELIKLLNESDKQSAEDEKTKKFTFKSGDDFLELDADAQVEYLDEIFGLPDGVEENSDDEEEYISAMTEAVVIYGGLSLEEKVVDKIKEILDWANDEDEDDDEE